MFEDTGKNVQAEARDVLVLKFGVTADGDNVTAEGANVPNEVAVYMNDRTVGRATLHTREDGIYADIMLSTGSVEGQDANAIVMVHSYTRLREGPRVIDRYDVTGVGLTQTTAKATNEDENTTTEQSQG